MLAFPSLHVSEGWPSQVHHVIQSYVVDCKDTPALFRSQEKSKNNNGFAGVYVHMDLCVPAAQDIRDIKDFEGV